MKMTVKKTYEFINPIEVEFNIDGYLNPNENGDLEPEDYEYENKFKVSWKINDRVRLYKLGQVSKLKGNKLVKKTFTLVCLFVGISLFIKSILNFF